MSDMKKDSSARKPDMPQPARAEKVSNKNGEARETTVLPPAMLPCATTTYVLGTRCAHGHTYGSNMPEPPEQEQRRVRALRRGAPGGSRPPRQRGVVWA